ncbi:MAG: exonuclease [Deltaproteobacteria bacterium]|nr:exonuclease [Deltaproteobacteria bacterium]TLN00676.1 MAG: recombination-associated protein RdgC [bacterium]
MGILSNTVSICQFKVVGEIPDMDTFAWVSERLTKNGFISIDHGTEELSVGWVTPDDHRTNDFSVPSAFWRDNYLFFTLRQDKRNIPAALLKAYQKVAEEEFLFDNPGFTRVPKQKREELKESVRISLLARTLPVPSTCDAVWDTRSNTLSIASVSAKTVEQFDNLFKKTFENFRLVAIHPFARAENVIPAELSESLQKANRAGSEAVLDLIRSNLWLGTEFFLWLTYRTLNESGEYRIVRPGPAGAGEPFTAYVNDRLVLCGAGDDGAQKITISGPQDRFGEVRLALSNGKMITEATLYLEKGEHIWKMTLKGEMFQFASYKTPKVQQERDSGVDEISEREALFYEKMYVMEVGLQMFDSLFAAFLTARLEQGWGEEVQKIDAWLTEQ